MRIDMTERRAKDAAKALKKSQALAPAQLSYQQCLEVVAGALGAASWNTLQSQLSRDPDDSTPKLTDTPANALLAELDRRGEHLVLPLPAMQETAPEAAGTLAARLRALLTKPDEAPDDIIMDLAHGALDNIDELVARLADDLDELPAGNAGSLPDPARIAETDRLLACVDCQVVEEPSTYLKAISAAAFEADDRLTEIRFAWRPGGSEYGKVGVEVQDRDGPVKLTHVHPLTARALFDASNGDSAMEEMSILHRNHAFGDDRAVLVMMRSGYGFLFVNDAPEAGYLGDGDRIGLLFDNSRIPGAGTRPRHVHLLTARQLLADRWADLMPTEQPARPDYTARILAHFGEGPAPRLFGFTLDVTDQVLDPRTPLQAVRKSLQDGVGHWRLDGAPTPTGPRPFNVQVRSGAEAFFGKPVNEITDSDRAAARRALGWS
ncbi:hypothetical protein CKO28_00940 [Rhodovibrio sodomensis]|uniref:Glyoxalase-related protein domain-containing protein n=1 Tax=Rhodovibrio sodomensis TaxID=1088 RepID=A0ABS1DA33_9PROT|nr:glyoxalase superfamily protein [Rhodovibrio sodomensis]MBK1666608.1 hypothetical protein [Rhodovibrio sodomensis]